MNHKQSPEKESVVWAGILSDAVLALVKGSVGYLSGSKALLGDALYSGADAVSRLSDAVPLRHRKPVTGGRGRDGSEPVVSILCSVLILMGGLQIAFSAIRDLSSGELEVPGRSALVTVLIAIMLKEAIFQYQFRSAKKRADGSHAVYVDNHRYSLYSSITVLVGIASAMAGEYFEVNALLYMDPIAALLVGCLVLRKGYSMITVSLHGTKDQEIPYEETANFIDTVQRVRGVIRVEHLQAVEQGHNVNLSVKVSVNPRITVLEAQEIAECARKLLQHRFVHISEVHVDVIPYDPGYPYKSNYELVDNDAPTLLQ